MKNYRIVIKSRLWSCHEKYQDIIFLPHCPALVMVDTVLVMVRVNSNPAYKYDDTALQAHNNTLTLKMDAVSVNKVSCSVVSPYTKSLLCVKQPCFYFEAEHQIRFSKVFTASLNISSVISTLQSVLLNFAACTSAAVPCLEIWFVSINIGLMLSRSRWASLNFLGVKSQISSLR